MALDPTRTRVRARLSVRPNAAGRREPLRLDGRQLELQSIAVDGKTLGKKDYKLTETSLTLVKTPAKPFTLEIVTILNPEANKALQGLYRTNNVYCTQCEAEGFRRITYFLDRPDVLATYTVRIEADRREAPVLLANGNLRESGSLPGGKRHYAIWHDPFPKPSYLFALVGGDLASIKSSFTTMSGREVALAIYVEHGKEERAAWAMDSLKRAMRWDEVRFGREYDLDVFNIVAVSDFNMGAMENKGLNVFNDRLILASPETATDVIFEAIEAVVAHEYFHNWTGNRITCRDWFQLCLKEGLTVFRDQEFSGDERSATVQRILDVRQLKTHQFAEDAGPLAHPVRPESYIEINNFYTATVYEKGAEVVRMLQTLLGHDKFRKGMDLYFERHDGEAATVEQFVRCFEDASGHDLAQFRLWYSQAGTPELVCALRYDKAKKRAELDVEQVLPPTPGQPHKKPMHIPLKLGLLGANGHDVALKLDSGETPEDGVLAVTKRRQTFRFVDVPSRPVPSLLRDFSAPVNVTLDLADADVELLMAGDSDLFNRWQAANSFATRTLVEIAGILAQGKQTSRGARYVKALGAAITGDALEPAYRAELLKLPTQADVARVIGRNVDPALIHRAHRRLSKLIGTHARALARGSLRRDGGNRALLARRRERRPPQPAQRRAHAIAGARDAGGCPAARQALLQGDEHDGSGARPAPACRLRRRRRRAGARRLLRPLQGRSRRHRYLVCRTGAVAARRHAAQGRGAHPAPALCADRAQQGARPHRHVRHGQSRAVQPARRSGLPLRRRPGAGARPHQPADRRPHARCVPQLAGAGDGSPGARAQGAAASCTHQTTVL